MRRRATKIEPPTYKPKFAAGDRVRVSGQGILRNIARAGTEGTVESCGLVVYVSIDGKKALAYHVDFWDAVPGKK